MDMNINANESAKGFIKNPLQYSIYVPYSPDNTALQTANVVTMLLIMTNCCGSGN